MPSARKKGKRSSGHCLTNFLIDMEQRHSKVSQDGAGQHEESQAYKELTSPYVHSNHQNSEYDAPLSKADLDASLTSIFNKLVDKIEKEVHSSTAALSQEIANIGNRTDMLETKHDELSLAHNDLRKDYENLADNFAFMQAQVEDLDNRNRRHNIRLRGVPETVTELMPAVSKIFHGLLPDKPVTAFACDRIHRALRPKPTADNPPRDIIMCMKDFLVKEDIMRASRNTPNISHEGKRIQIYPDISPATLGRRRRMKEVTSVLQSARIRYRWGFPFKLTIPHNGSTYTVYNVIEGKELLIKLGLLTQDPHAAHQPHQGPHLFGPPLPPGATRGIRGG